MKYLKRFLLAREKPLTKPTQPHAEDSSVSFVSENDTSPSAPSASGTMPPELPVQSSEQEQRIRILSRQVSRKAAWRTLKRIQPELRLNVHDRLELALSLALLDAGIDFTEVLNETLQNQSSKTEPE